MVLISGFWPMPTEAFHLAAIDRCRAQSQEVRFLGRRPSGSIASIVVGRQPDHTLLELDDNGLGDLGVDVTARWRAASCSPEPLNFFGAVGATRDVTSIGFTCPYLNVVERKISPFQ
ncbi:hypothetical protein [Marinivivus vitaminiproducens]|uniref:hypothetical protein n=1 Tax=Marinivivus vitaminiproducens TaxID=3035935 RepID=UPI0027A5493D|nr:hypothetical protein P4R82_09840 [Geminicoccaceae bacterium SCSIO 64248]